MCIEVYAEECIEIAFESEYLTFTSEVSFEGDYKLLVRNCGQANIRTLYCLFPRPLLSVSPKKIPQLHNVQNIAPEVIAAATADSSGKTTWNNGRLFAKIPDPNLPENYLPHMSGRLGQNDFCFRIPRGIESRHIDLLSTLGDGYSAWTIQLERPLEVNDAQWICLRIAVDDCGRVLPDSLSGKVVYHSFASPESVRNTVVDTFEEREEEAFSSETAANDMIYYETFLDLFKLRSARSVDIQYYELTICPGDSHKREILNWSYEGCLWMRSSSPHVESYIDSGNGTTERMVYEPVFQWKSGSHLFLHQDLTRLRKMARVGLDERDRARMGNMDFRVWLMMRTASSGYSALRGLNFMVEQIASVLRGSGVSLDMTGDSDAPGVIKFPLGEIQGPKGAADLLLVASMKEESEDS